MNGAHWHLVVNHLPIVFPIVGITVSITGIISKSEAVKRTAYLIYILGAFASIAAMASGEEAEDTIKKINGISKNYIETHEEIAERFALITYILGSLSLLGLWSSFKQKKYSTIINILCLIISVISLFFAKETGTSGGEIRHTEIRVENNHNATEEEHNNEKETENE